MHETENDFMKWLGFMHFWEGALQWTGKEDIRLKDVENLWDFMKHRYVVKLQVSFIRDSFDGLCSTLWLGKFASIFIS